MDLGKVTRRRFLWRAALPTIAAGMGLDPRLSTAAQAVTSVSVLRPQGPAPIPVTLNVNGTPQALLLEPRVTLLDALRERLGLTGTKKGCDQGACGACTILVNGQRVNSCLTLAVMHDGADIVTIEGLANNGRLHPLQQAFIDEDAFQCGYCTAGQILSGVGCISEGHAGSPAEIREWMSGNICRCGAYTNIVTAIANTA